MIKIREAHILYVNLPLKIKFKHALTSRSESESIFLKVILEDGTAGYGESLPREYVTGETAGSVKENLKNIIKQRILRFASNDYKGVSSFIDRLNIKGGAAKCALELALLDAYGRHFNTPLSSIIGERVHDAVLYSGVIQAGSISDVIKVSLAFKVFGFRFVKVKVGLDNDIKRLEIIRRILGQAVNIRVDANCAWSPEEAIEKIKAMRRFVITAVEQPVKKGDYQGLKRVTDSTPETIIADEGLCTVDDAVRLARLRACNMFNIRISKCGGLLNSLKIADIARRNNIGVQLGCQVGESGLLSAAGRHFAGAVKELSFCEGSYGKYLLKEDITKEDMTFRRGGIGDALSGPGLGVTVLERVLDKYLVSKDVIA